VPDFNLHKSEFRFICPNVGAGFQPAQKWVQVFNLHKNHAGRGLTAG
jgi:hypothetical protein